MRDLHLTPTHYIIAAIAIALLVALFLFISRRSHRSKLSARAAKLQTRRISKPNTNQDLLSLRKQERQVTSRLIELLMRPLPDIETLNYRLQRAGSNLSARNFILRALLFTSFCTVSALALHKSPVLGLSLGVILGFWLPMKVLGFKIASQQKKFLQLFPDAIDLIVRGLRSGLPVSESINLVAHEVPEPVGSTFKLIANTMHLGVPLEVAMIETAKKLGSTEFNFFTTSIILQKETGGNLSEILNNLGEVIRKRYMMKMKIKAMTSEARASSIIIGALPFFVTGAIFVMSPDYLGPLWEDPRGHKAIGVAAAMLYTGVWSMNRMAKFEI